MTTSKMATPATKRFAAPAKRLVPAKPGVRGAAVKAARLASGKMDTKLFSRLVSDVPVGGIAAIRFIREGYSAKVLKAASGFFGVPEARIQKIVHVPASTASRLEKKEANIDSAATERVYRMGMVTRMAIEVFESAPSAIEWMRQPNRALGDAAPLDLMDTEPGAVSVRQVLNAIATGGVA